MISFIGLVLIVWLIKQVFVLKRQLLSQIDTCNKNFKLLRGGHEQLVLSVNLLAKGRDELVKVVNRNTTNTQALFDHIEIEESIKNDRSIH